MDISIFKAYDIRGIVPDQLNADLMEKIGRAFVAEIKPRQVVIGYDMRISSPELKAALVKGITATGTDVIDIGQCGTEMIYFASGRYGFDGGIMITASHNPSQYNGLKIVKRGAAALSGEQGIFAIRDRILKDDLSADSPNPGQTEQKDIWSDYIQHVLSFVDINKLKPLKIAIDAGNGMGGEIVKHVFRNLPFDIVPLYFEPDGRFPYHIPNPLEPENTQDLRQKILAEKCDLGIAFDGDADRMFLLDNQGNLIPGTITTALIAKNILQKHPGTTVLYNAVCGWIVPETIRENGGQAIKTPVGHSIIKQLMRQHDAIFGGEHSAHYYYRDNFYADSAFISALICLELICQEGKLLSEIIQPFQKYPAIPETNSKVHDIAGKLQEIEEKYSDGQIDKIDGLSVDYPDWHFNVRPSNTEPLLRLNMEAKTQDILEEKSREILDLIRK